MHIAMATRVRIRISISGMGRSITFVFQLGIVRSVVDVGADRL